MMSLAAMTGQLASPGRLRQGQSCTAAPPAADATPLRQGQRPLEVWRVSPTIRRPPDRSAPLHERAPCPDGGAQLLRSRVHLLHGGEAHEADLPAGSLNVWERAL